MNTKTHWLAVGVMTAILSTRGLAMTVNQTVDASWVREHPKEFSVTVQKNENGLLAFTVVRTLSEPKYLVVSVAVYRQGTLIGENHTPLFAKTNENRFHFSVAPEHLGEIAFEISESFAPDGIPKPGTIIYQFRLRDFVPANLLGNAFSNDAAAQGARRDEGRRLPPHQGEVSRTTDTLSGGLLLSHGSPVPTFAGAKFLRGPAFGDLSPGTNYVIEFSGTACVPCRKAIPHLEELQRRHKEVVFVSVFSEPEGDVRRYLDGPGKAITMRVVCDPDQALKEAWLVAAAQLGIPRVFVVDSAGKITWIGHPEELDEPLAKTVAGKPIAPVDAVEEMRRRIEKGALLSQKRTREREAQSSEENNNRVTTLIQRGDFEQAIQALDELIATYHDLPSRVDAFRGRKLFVLGQMPGRGEEAFSLALDLAVEARLEGSLTASSVANAMMNHYERCLPENRDARMLNLALALLHDAKVPDDESVGSLNDRCYHFDTLSRAYGLRGSRGQALVALRQAIEAAEKTYECLRSADSGGQSLEAQQSLIAELRGRLNALETR